MEFRNRGRHLARLLLLSAVCLLTMGMVSLGNAAAPTWATKAPMPIAMSRGNANVVSGSLYVLGGSFNGAALNSVQEYNPVADSWSLRPPLPESMFTGASDVVNEKIYVAGGFDANWQFRNNVFWYDTVTGSSQQIGSLIVPRGRFGGAIVDNRFYAVGGSSVSGDLASIEEIDLATGVSVIKQNLPRPTSLAGVTAVNGKVYIFGGWADSARTNEAWEYNPVDNVLTPLPPMPVASEFETALPYNGKIYLVSSFAYNAPTEGNQIQAYDIQNRSWELVSTVPTARNVPMAGIVNGRLQVTGGFSDGSNSGTVNEILSFGEPAPSWSTKAPMPIPMSTGCASAVNGSLYVLGGVNNSLPTDTVQAYNPAADAWSLLPPLPAPMFTGACAALQEKIFVFGGFGQNWEQRNSVFSYDTVTGASQQVGTLVEPRSRFSGAIVANRFYAVGGTGTSGALASIEEFDLTTGVSVTRQYLPRPVSLAGVAASGGKIYIFGGFVDGLGVSGEGWEYDPQTNQYLPLPPMPVACELETALPSNGKIYLVSSYGYDMPNQTNLVQAYDIQNRTWEIVSSVPTPRSVPMAGIVDGTLYVAGGYLANGNGSVNEALPLGAGSAATMTLHSVSPWATDNIDWPAAQHGPLNTGNYLRINGVYYYVIMSSGTSWSGPEYATAWLATCDQVSGAPLLPYAPFNYGPAYLNDMAGMPITLFESWPLPVTPDDQPPVTWLSYSTTGRIVNGWFDAPVTVTLTSTDSAGGSGTALIEYSYDGSSWQTYTYPLVISQQGSTTLYYRSTDRAQNVSVVSAASFAIDTTTPTTTATLAGTQGNNGWLVSPATLTLAASDPTTYCIVTGYSINGGNWKIYTAPLTFADPGNYTVQYSSTDFVSNSEPAKTIQFKIDPTPPTASHSLSGTLGTNGWYTSDVTVALSAVDSISAVSRIEYRLNGGAWTTYSAPFIIGAEGTAAIDYRAIDNAGNMIAAQIPEVKIDKTAPVSSAAVSGPLGDNGIYTGDVQVALAASDAVSGLSRIEYSFDGSTWLAYSAPVAISSAGTATLFYRAVDSAGIAENPAKSLVIIIDKTAPSVEATAPVNAAADVLLNEVITVTFSENVVAGSTYGSISLMKGKTVVPMTAAVSGAVLKLTPNALLAKNTKYAVSVPAGAVKDLAGRPLATPLNFSFTTARR